MKTAKRNQIKRKRKKEKKEEERRKEEKERRKKRKKEERRERKKRKKEERRKKRKKEERKKRKLTDFPTHIGTRWSLRKSNPTVKFTFNETNEPTTISSFDFMERSRNLEMFIK